MKMSRNYKKLCLVLGLSTVLSTGVVDAANYTKTLKASYNNIRVSYNGVLKSMSAEPFTVDNVTYVPLRAVGEAMGVNVNWDGPNKTVVITGNNGDTANTTALQQELATANYNLAVTQRELAAVKQELATLKAGTGTGGVTTGTTITTDQIKASEDYLNSEFGYYFNKIPFTFNLTKSANKFNVSLSYSTSSANKEFDKLRESQIKSYLTTVCEGLLQRHQGMGAQGSIDYKGTQKYTFDYNPKSGDLNLEQVIELNEGDISDFLRKNYSSLNSSNIGSLIVNSVSTSVSDRKQTITCTFYVDTPTAEQIAIWNSMHVDSNLEYRLSSIAGDIQDEYETDYEIYFDICDKTSRIRVAEYNTDDERLILSAWR